MTHFEDKSWVANHHSSTPPPVEIKSSTFVLFKRNANWNEAEVVATPKVRGLNPYIGEVLKFKCQLHFIEKTEIVKIKAPIGPFLRKKKKS